MRYRRQVALILALGIMWGLVYYVRVARAQAWSDTCAHPRDLCVAGAQSTRLTCYSNCDSQYGSGTQADITCRNSCDATYSSYVAANCTTPYNNCMSLRSGTCSGTLCPSYCSGTTGVVSCSYSDPAMDCQFSCGCPLSSKPPCSGEAQRAAWLSRTARAAPGQKDQTSGSCELLKLNAARHCCCKRLPAGPVRTPRARRSTSYPPAGSAVGPGSRSRGFAAAR